MLKKEEQITKPDPLLKDNFFEKDVSSPDITNEKLERLKQLKTERDEAKRKYEKKNEEINEKLEKLKAVLTSSKSDKTIFLGEAEGEVKTLRDRWEELETEIGKLQEETKIEKTAESVSDEKDQIAPQELQENEMESNKNIKEIVETEKTGIENGDEDEEVAEKSSAQFVQNEEATKTEETAPRKIETGKDSEEIIKGQPEIVGSESPKKNKYEIAPGDDFWTMARKLLLRISMGEKENWNRIRGMTFTQIEKELKESQPDLCRNVEEAKEEYLKMLKKKYQEKFKLEEFVPQEKEIIKDWLSRVANSLR